MFFATRSSLTESPAYLKGVEFSERTVLNHVPSSSPPRREIRLRALQCPADRPAGRRQDHARVALARRAVEAGYRGYYTTAADLVARTSKAAAEGRWQNTMRFWAGPGVLVVDELDYPPLPGAAASHLFQVVSRRYESGSIILTTNRGIAEWGEEAWKHLGWFQRFHNASSEPHY